MKHADQEAIKQVLASWGPGKKQRFAQWMKLCRRTAKRHKIPIELFVTLIYDMTCPTNRRPHIDNLLDWSESADFAEMAAAQVRSTRRREVA